MTNCARGYRCPGRTKTGTDDHGKPTYLGAETTRTLCDTCADHLAANIRDLPNLYVDLNNLLPPGQHGGDGRGSRGDISAPVNLTVEAQMRRAVLVATTWEAVVRDIAGEGDTASRVRDYTALATACAYLATRVTALTSLLPTPVNRWDPAATLPDTGGDVVVQVEMDGADAALELFEVYEDAYFTVGIGVRTELLEQPCWDCGVEAVTRVVGNDPGSDRVTCLACKASMSLDDYDAMTYRSAHFRTHGHMRIESVQAVYATCDCTWRGPLRMLEQLAADDMAAHTRLVADVRNSA
jgi:hypothetical protein